MCHHQMLNAIFFTLHFVLSAKINILLAVITSLFQPHFSHLFSSFAQNILSCKIMDRKITKRFIIVTNLHLNCMGTLQEEVRAAQAADGQGQALEMDEVQPEPLDMAFPDGFQKQVTYLLLFPIIFPLWLTLPDTRSQKGE